MGMKKGRASNQRFLRALPLLSVLGLFPVVAQASSGTEGAAFLDIPVGAGPAAMGSAYSALATDAYAPVWNPAGLGFMPDTEVAAQHLSYLQSIYYEFASFAHPVGDGKAFGLSAQYLGSGDIQGTGPNDEPIGAYSNRFASYNLAYGQRLGSSLAFGMTGKWINEKLADVSANAYAADLGLLYKATERLQGALTVTNVGSSLKFVDQADPLPMAVHLGAAGQPWPFLKLAGEGVYSRSGLLSGRAGAEWSPLEMIGIRAGYKTDTTKGLSPLAGLTVGLGLRIWGQEFAYAWLPYGDLGDTQYISMLLRFGAPEEARRNLIQYQSIKRHRTVEQKTTEPEYEQLMQLLSTDESERIASQTWK